MQKSIEYIANGFLTGLGMTVSLADGRKIGLIPAVDDGGETVKWYAGGDGVQVQIQPRLIELFEKIRELLFIQGGDALLRDIRIGFDHGSSVELQGAVYENFQGMDLQMLRVVFTIHALELFQALLDLPRR